MWCGRVACVLPAAWREVVARTRILEACPKYAVASRVIPIKLLRLLMQKGLKNKMNDWFACRRLHETWKHPGWSSTSEVAGDGR